VNVPTLAAYPRMMQRARKRERVKVCRAAWLIGVTVREYRELEAGDRMPSPRRCSCRPPEFHAPGTGSRFLAMATLESVRTLLATFRPIMTRTSVRLSSIGSSSSGTAYCSLVAEERIASRASSRWTNGA